MNNMNLGKKGIAMWILYMLTALFAIGLIAFFYFLLIGRYFDIHAIIVSNEAQRHAINMAQVLLSSDKLVYEEKFANGLTRYHRAVFDKNKLDVQLFTSLQDAGSKVSEVQKEISYPNTGTQIVVNDLVSGSSWILSFGGPGLENYAEFISCLNDNIDKNIFSRVFNIPQNSPWNFWDMQECTATYTTKIGIFEKDFPVLIKVGEDMHPGRLFIRVMEL